MAKVDFINQLKALGYEPQELNSNFVSIDYTIPVGKFIGQKVAMAFENPGSFPLAPPHGPHFNQQLLSIGRAGIHPYGGVHRSKLGIEWQHWSRPFNEWNKTDKTVRTYLAHIRNILNFN